MIEKECFKISDYKACTRHELKHNFQQRFKPVSEDSLSCLFRGYDFFQPLTTSISKSTVHAIFSAIRRLVVVAEPYPKQLCLASHFLWHIKAN